MKNSDGSSLQKKQKNRHDGIIDIKKLEHLPKKNNKECKYTEVHFSVRSKHNTMTTLRYIWHAIVFDEEMSMAPPDLQQGSINIVSSEFQALSSCPYDLAFL